MKLKFEDKLEYQRKGINAVVGLFEGQPVCNSEFTVKTLTDEAGTEGKLITATGIGNRLMIDEEDISKNLKTIQEGNYIPHSGALKKNNYNFDVEMETGTGKTYVFLRTIFELNKKYGFTKFVIVVPSIAIKEGTIKSLTIMREHFKGLYNNVIFNSAVYESKNINSIKQFAVSTNIEIMIMTIQSFNKNTNVINNTHEKTDGLRPLQFIQDTSPIVIIDEPQTTISTDIAKKAIEDLNPLFTLRYSATHRDIENLVYSLNSIDAYEQGLVKEIEVASIETIDNHNSAYLNLISVDNTKSPMTAKIEVEAKKGSEVEKKIIIVRQGSDIYELSGNRDVYDGYFIKDICAKKGYESIDFTTKDSIYLGEVRGTADDELIKRLQIRKTIEEHLRKEKEFKSNNIKVLSLFFIDKVANYREYDEKGNPLKGKYAKWFEEEFKRAIQKEEYQEEYKGLDLDELVNSIHNGYFSKDKKGFKDTSGKSNADEDTFNLIMKDKEKLLSFSSKLKFIFSHSTLKEGWDNPNIFQICTLNETKSKYKKRQEIGRGLRLCVNQDGDRVRDKNINILTVMANESYETFAKGLQKEYEEEGVKFGIIEENAFYYVCKSIIQNSNGEEEKVYLGNEKSKELFKFLKDENFIDKTGKVQDTLKEELKAKTLELPKEFKEIEKPIIEILKKVSGGLNIKNRSDRKVVKISKRFEDEDFKNLWNKIKHKTTYSVDFNSEALINDCSQKIEEELVVQRASYRYSKGKLEKDVSGVHGGLEMAGDIEEIDYLEYDLPDILSYLQNETGLTRNTIIEILTKCNRLDDFKLNPQKFMDEVAKIVNKSKKLLIVDGIKYEKTGESYLQQQFVNKELIGYLNKNMIESKKSVYDYVIYDSNIERDFTKELEASELVKVYAKMPKWFKIDTPLGSYNPDWAVYIKKNNEEKLYFVLETKGSLDDDERRGSENAKIACGKKHFIAIDEERDEISLKVAVTFKEFIKTI